MRLQQPGKGPQIYSAKMNRGWREASYCPKDGTHFQAIEAGSTGIHDANYTGEWPNGSWWITEARGVVGAVNCLVDSAYLSGQA